MKFLPKKFREGQTDWFGKRGINWHIPVCATKPGDNFELDTYVHILDSQSSQDSQLTAALLVDVVKDMAIHKRIDQVHIWSDNAGCYKSTNIIHTLYQELPNLIKTYNFCEAQDGKAPCDRKASHIKSSIKRCINEGNDVLDASQMKKAIDTQQRGKYRVKVVTPIIDADAEKTNVKPIPNISSLNNFEFSAEGLKMRRAYNIGPGKLIPWNRILVPVIQLNVVHICSTGVAPAILPQGDESNEQDECVQPVQKKRKTADHVIVFYCSNESCDRAFKTMASLENHLLLGDYSVRSEKKLHDKCKTMYQDKLDKLVHVNNKTLDSDDANTSIVLRNSSLPPAPPLPGFCPDQAPYSLIAGIVPVDPCYPAQVAS
ncbi:uncharacterized protein LOC111134867 [Crassostrea virginica]